MPAANPVNDWTTDYDILDDDYVADPYPVWADLRDQCPIAHTDRWGGSWLPTRYADVAAIAHDVEHFSSRDVGVLTFTAEERPPPPIDIPLPPIDADPPVHTWTRRLLLPWFSHTRVDGYEQFTRDLCNRLIDEFIDNGSGDAAQDYAQQIPVRVIALTLGVPAEMSDTFTGWVRDVLEFAHDEVRSAAGRDNIVAYLLGQLEERRSNPGDDLISAVAPRRSGGRTGPRSAGHGHRRADLDRRRGHHVVGDRLGHAPPRHAPRGRTTPDRRARADADGRRGTAPCLLPRSPWPGSPSTTSRSADAR